MKYRQIIFILTAIALIFFLILSCEEKTNWELKSKPVVKLIVEGSVTNEKKSHLVKLSYPVQSMNDIPKPVSGAQISISDNSASDIFHESPLNSGLYYTEFEFRGTVGKVYTLKIEFENNLYFAQSEMVSVEPLEQINIEEVKDSAGFYKYQYVKSREPSMLEVFINWERVNTFPDVVKAKRKAKLVYFTLKTIDISEIFKPGQENIYFPKGTQIIRRKYSLNADEQKFVRSLMLETEWRGGRFDVIPDNVHTNLSEGATGYFGAYTVVSDTVIFN